MEGLTCKVGTAVSLHAIWKTRFFVGIWRVCFKEFSHSAGN